MLPIKQVIPPRSLHCDDGANRKRVRFLATGDADGACLDFEDNCSSPGQATYDVLAQTVAEDPWGNKILSFRSRPVGHPGFIDDIKMGIIAGGGRVDFIIVPKVKSGDDTALATRLAIETAESAGHPAAPGIVALIELEEAVDDLEDIVVGGGRGLVGLLFGSVDFCSSAEIPPKEGQLAEAIFYPPHMPDPLWPRRYAQQQIIAAARMKVAKLARRAGIMAIDGVRTAYQAGKDVAADAKAQEDLVATSVYSRALGYHGRFIIHRSQVVDANLAYSISRAEFIEATRLVTVFDEHEGTAAFPDPQGKDMIDAAVVRGSLKVLDAAGRSHQIDDALRNGMLRVAAKLPPI